MRRLFLSFLIPFLACATVCSQTQNSRYQQYISQYKDCAIEQMLKWKIPASITLAQGLLESGAGQSSLARKANNHFGIKCHGWSGGKTYQDDDERDECFRAYRSAYESYEDHSEFLATGQRYRSLFNLKITDYKGWAKGLKAAGYATNPNYANSLINLIELYRLYEYDHAKSYDKYMASHSKDVNADGQSLHPIYKSDNGNYYLYARQGDTFRSIGKEIGVSYRRIAKYNERNKKDVLNPGEIIWLKKKARKAPKGTYFHVVANGDSMYGIAQKYGIRLERLYKMNRLEPSHSIRVGEILKLR